MLQDSCSIFLSLFTYSNTRLSPILSFVELRHPLHLKSNLNPVLENSSNLTQFNFANRFSLLGMDTLPLPPQSDEIPRRFPDMSRSDSSGASSDSDAQSPQIIAPVPVRPRLPSRQSSGTIIVPRDSVNAGESTDTWLDSRDVRTMSPRRTSEDIEALGREARDELRR